MQLSVIISVLLPLLALFNTGDAITGWSEPSITGADGTGAYSFAESTSIGPLSKTIVATAGAGQAIVSYELLTASTPFSLIGTDGNELNLVSALDFETTASYIIEIKAVDDTATTALSATATLTITVTDVNDETPTFGAPAYSKCIADGSAIGTTLATILANDADAADTTFTNTLTSETGGTTVFAASTAGIITSTAVMAAATTSKYEIILTAEDAASHTATTTINVEVGCSSATTVAIGITTLLVALVTALQ